MLIMVVKMKVGQSSVSQQSDVVGGFEGGGKVECLICEGLGGFASRLTD